MTDAAEHDAIAARAVGEAGDRSRPSAYFPEGALDDIGGAHLFPMVLRDVEEV